MSQLHFSSCKQSWKAKLLSTTVLFYHTTFKTVFPYTIQNQNTTAAAK